MKKLISFLPLLLIISCASVQTPEPRVFSTPNRTKKQIYNRTIQWVSENFRSGKEVVQYKNLEEGRIICQGVATVRPGMDLYERGFEFTWVIDIKPNRIRLKYKNIQPRHMGNVAGLEYNSLGARYIDNKIDSMVNSLLQYIKNPGGKSDW